MESDQASSAVRAAKAEMRTAALERRRRAATDAGPSAPHRLAERFVDSVPVPQGAVVSAFWPMGDEIDVRPLLTQLHGRDHPCCLPVTGRRGSVLRFRRWSPGMALVPAVLGTREPPPSAKLLEPDLLLVPLLAFDAAGWRLGYGGGYYDRTLADLRARRPVLAVGVAFAAQEVPMVPRDGSDERLDWVITEQGATRMADGS